MLAIWRVHGVDQVLRDAWEAGCVMTGWSAGMNCWFEASVTDSFGARRLRGVEDGLGWLGGSACPHYDGEELRRPAYQALVAGGFPPGVAAEDGVGLVYDGTALAEAVSWRGDGRAWRVAPVTGGGCIEDPLPVRRV
jgi:peptidase E